MRGYRRGRRKNPKPSHLKKVTRAPPKKVGDILEKLGYIREKKEFWKGNIHIRVIPSTTAPKGGAKIFVHKDILVGAGQELGHRAIVDDSVRKASEEIIKKIRKTK